jgi:hypothetical protein
MEDKYLDEVLALQMPASTNFVATDIDEKKITIDQRDRFEEILLNATNTKNDQAITYY